MGLDMYLHRKPRKDEDIKDDIQLVYWRKCNAVHEYFVGDAEEDNCVNFEVSRDDIFDLITKCTMVLNDKSLADELLPTRSGFFFGSYEYDQWYFDMLKDTVKDCTDVLEDWKEGDQVYYYAWY